VVIQNGRALRMFEIIIHAARRADFGCQLASSFAEPLRFALAARALF
jgi:hypothetical protein